MKKGKRSALTHFVHENEMDENFRTFMQHHFNFIYYDFLKKVQKEIYIPIISLNAKVSKSKEPVPFKDICNLSFIDIKVNESWGGFFDCAWFAFNGKLPQNICHENLVVRINVGGEGCIYNEFGVVQGITNVLGMVDNFQTAKGKQIVPLNRIGEFKDGIIKFYADCGNNGRGGKSRGESKLILADICRENSKLIGLYYDFLSCWQLLYAVKDSKKKAIIRCALNKSISLYKNTEVDIEKARNALSLLLDGSEKQDFTVYAEGHGHLDLAWLWPVRETKRKAVRTFSNAIYKSEKCPGYVFNGSQPQQYEFIKEQSPELFERVKQAVKNGNIEPQGGMWVEADTNITGGESLVRQCAYGKKYFRDNFNVDVKTLWLPDVFGYTAALPQIIKKCGMDNFMTIKLSWNNINQFPHQTFLWQGLDNSNVLVHMPPEGDYNSNATPFAFNKIAKTYKEKEISNIALMPFGIGDGGAGPGEYHVEMAKRCEKLRYIPNVKMASSKEFFEKLSENTEKYPKYKGELYLEKHQGTYTTQVLVKKNNRLCERLLHNAEWLATLAYLKTGEYPYEKLRTIWNEVLLYHFHDILPGSSIHRVYEECNKRYADLQKELNGIIEKSISELTDGESKNIVVNPTSFSRKGFIKNGADWYKYDVMPYASAEIIKADNPRELKVTCNSIENNKLIIEFNSCGQITKFTKKTDGHNFVKSFFNAPRIYKDRFVHPYNAWDIDINYTKQKPTDMKCTSLKTYVDGNSAVCEMKYEYNKSQLYQKVILIENEDYCTVLNNVNWHETHKMLRIDAYPAEFSNEVLCDIQFGNIKRSTKTDNSIDYAQFEIPAHKWVDVYDVNYGVAILNDCKYGYRVKDGLISLNCLRSTVYPDKTADRGEHSFTYAIYPHTQKPLESDLVKIGYEINNPLIFSQDNLSLNPIATSESKNIILETVMTETDDSIVLRFYENSGRDTIAKININVDYKEIYETDMLLENAKDIDLNHISFSPYEIKTIKLRR